MEYAGGIAETNRVAEETQVFGVGEAQRSRVDGLVSTAHDLFFRTQVLAPAGPEPLPEPDLSLLVAGPRSRLCTAGSGHVASLGAVVLLLVRAGSYGQQVQGAYQAPPVAALHRAPAGRGATLPRAGRSTGKRRCRASQTLAFEHVFFAYRPGRPVLSDISFEVAAGEAIGIIGPSGAGKSTLVQILLQLRTPERGSLSRQRQARRGVRARGLARQVAYVPQEPRLLHASVAENIRFFRDLDDEAVERAGRLARIHDDIMGWPNGYDTIVGPRADAVSGGQQQRICLARALAARPEVLVLDEPTSALDPHSETLIQESLTALKSELTLFIIAHRMSTLDICDRVMVIVDGRLVAFDTKALLQRDNPYYRSASMLAAGAPEGARLMQGTARRRPERERRVATGRGGSRAPSCAQSGSRTSSSSATPKSGTTALYEMLQAPPADLHARLQGAVVLRRRAARSHPPRPEGTPQTLEEYLSLFDGGRPEQRVGEASVLYLWSRSAAGRIAEVQPDARIIAILREPASFLRSLHLQFVQTYVETENDLRKALALEDAGARAERSALYLLAAGAPVLRARALRRAAAPLSRRVPARADAGAHLRRLSRRQRGDGARRCCASWRSTTRCRST